MIKAEVGILPTVGMKDLLLQPTRVPGMGTLLLIKLTVPEMDLLG